jgi:4-hydroxy-tetrahydrodipicolinate reductase
VAAIPIAIFGISGRMGQSLIQALREQPGSPTLTLTGAIASAGSARLGLDAATAALGGGPLGLTAATGVRVTADAAAALRGVKVALDFSQPGALLEHARACAAARVPLLVGVTGFDATARAELQSLSEQIPLLLAPNTSVGVAVVNELVAVAAKTLGMAWDVQIAEAHHAGKRDAPSGTALKLGETVTQVRGQTLSDIGISVLRQGDIVGEHTVSFSTAGESIEIAHRATDRMIFARGALRAAQWLAGRPPGLYAMKDVLGL